MKYEDLHDVDKMKSKCFVLWSVNWIKIPLLSLFYYQHSIYKTFIRLLSSIQSETLEQCLKQKMFTLFVRKHVRQLK